MRTKCENCGQSLTLDIEDDIFIGGECRCGYYVTRYLPGMNPEA